MGVNREKAAGQRSTRQRAVIVNALRNASGFRTAQELHRELTRRGGRVGLATVYRNLQSLADSGEVDVLRTDLGETIFRLCQEDDHHHHLICRRCGTTVEVVADEIETWATKVGRRYGFRQVTHTVEVYGVCKSCTA